MDDPRPDTDRSGEEERTYYAIQKHVWPFLAPFYEPSVFLPLRKLRRRVADCVHLPPGARLLDVATGTGGQARAFSAQAQEVVGVDMSEAMLRVARRTNRAPNVHFRQADAARLPFADLSFEAACVSFGLHEDAAQRSRSGPSRNGPGHQARSPDRRRRLPVAVDPDGSMARLSPRTGLRR